MYGNGNAQLVSAMEYILTEKAAENFIQFSEKDKIDIIPFASQVSNVKIGTGANTTELLNHIKSIEPNGSTALFPAAIYALDLLRDENQEVYNTSVILMTDGQGNIGRFSDLRSKYNEISKNIPIYSIMFGTADEEELEDIAKLTNAKIFDGKKDLVRAFKEVRGYN